MTEVVVHSDTTPEDEADRYHDLVVTPLQKAEHHLKQALRGLYSWCRQVEEGIRRQDGDFASEVAQAMDNKKEWVMQRVRWMRRVNQEYGTYEDPIGEWIGEMQDQERRLTWTAARRWSHSIASDSEAEQDAEAATETMQQIKRTERVGERFEKLVNDLARQYVENNVPDEVREEMESVLLKASEALRSGLPDSLPQSTTQPIESDVWREYVSSRHCIACGVPADHPHHLERRGTGYKESDFLCVPLCAECHQATHKIGEETFWKSHDVDPYKEALHLTVSFLEEAARHEQATT